MFNSLYTFKVNEDNKMTLSISVKCGCGNLVRKDEFLRTDTIDRKYSVTTSDR